MSDAYTRLTHFIDMTMQHIYQPVMLEVLLTHGGSASVRDVAAAILPHDESQLDYYEQIVKRMRVPCWLGTGSWSVKGTSTLWLQTSPTSRRMNAGI